VKLSNAWRGINTDFPERFLIWERSLGLDDLSIELAVHEDISTGSRSGIRTGT
jgi:hypothetical protein